MVHQRAVSASFAVAVGPDGAIRLRCSVRVRGHPGYRAVYLGFRWAGARIPLRPFFAITGAFLYFLAFKFMGGGIAELLYDTREPGRSNVGHELPGLTADQKTALLEYLKVL